MMPSQISQTIVNDDVAKALKEDIGSGDITAQITSSRPVTAKIISRESAILCGTPWATQVFNVLDARIEPNWCAKDGDAISKNQTICIITGPADAILTGERTALNFLQTLSATATETHKYVELVKNEKATILDTRKTIPGLRLAQKYAVTCGGGKNHRKGLYDGILIKENHIRSAGSIKQAIENARKLNTNLPVEIEVENLDELRQALETGIDIVLLDNFSITALKEAVTLNHSVNNGSAKLEASGGVDLENIKAIAKTGVDYISIGALTKHVRAIDLSMLFDVD